MKCPKRDSSGWAGAAVPPAGGGFGEEEGSPMTREHSAEPARSGMSPARDRLAGDPRRQMVPAGRDAGGRRAARVLVLPAGLGPAGGRRDEDAGRPDGVRTRRLSPAAHADARDPDPGDAGVLRPAAVLPGDARALPRGTPARGRPAGGAGAPGVLLRDVRPDLVGADAHRRLPDALSGLEGGLPSREPARHGVAGGRAAPPRLAVCVLRRRDGSDPAARVAATGLRDLLPDVRHGGTLVAGARRLGAGLHRTVRRAGDVLPGWW